MLTDEVRAATDDNVIFSCYAATSIGRDYLDPELTGVPVNIHHEGSPLAS